jgi:hypothetical protein
MIGQAFKEESQKKSPNSPRPNNVATLEATAILMQLR